MTIYEYIVIIIPLISLGISIFFNRNKTPVDNIFRVMLGYMFITELFGIILCKFTSYYKDYVIFNFYFLCLPLLLFLIFYKLTLSDIKKKRIRILSVILVLFFIIDNLIYKNIFIELQFHTYILALTMLIFLMYSNLIEIMNSDHISDYFRSKSVLISLGILIYSVPYMPIVIAFKVINIIFEVRWILALPLYVTMHTCFILASLWTRHK
ncbi:MAG: hypothetical protein IPH57_13140 [Saprospiraceae bacterium]|nr:hypothetical protein [Saprospiraceae bacterium]